MNTRSIIFSAIKKKKTITATTIILLFFGYGCSSSQKGKYPTIKVDGQTFYDFNNNGKLDIWEDTRLAEGQRIDAIVEQMTNEEKVELLIGTGMPGIEVLTGPVGDSKQGLVPGAAGGTAALDRFGIPATVVADGPAGLRISPTRENDSKTYYATAFPVGTALASHGILPC